MAVFLKKSIWGIIRLLGGFGMVQNILTGGGNNLPVLLRRICFAKIKKCQLFVYELILEPFARSWSRNFPTQFNEIRSSAASQDL